ncbi:MAG TPA: choice-of-anchor P family protein [Gemmatimonadales bacterium]|nr:choice-of-anchor P family protein [Gemmatimonadales bacterium]
MKTDSIRRAVRFLGLVLPLTWAPRAALAQGTATGRSYGVGVTTATVNQTVASAVLPAGEMLAQNQVSDATVGGLVSAQNIFSIVNGGGTDGSDAVSSATLGTVNVLNGLITADGVVAMATSTIGDVNAEGSSLANLVVNGVQVDNPAPNTQMSLPGVGYVVLNEQLPTSGGITVNMIHVVLQQAVLGLLGNVIGYRTTGNIIVGSASSSVN